MARFPASAASAAMTAASYRPARAALRIDATHERGTIPICASAPASAASTSSIACSRARSDRCAATSASPNSGPNRPLSLRIEENGLARSLDPDVEAIAALTGPPRHQRIPARRGNERQDRVAAVGLLVLEVQACDEARQDAPAHHADEDVRRLRAPSGRGDRARLDGVESIAAFLVRMSPPVAAERCIGFGRAWIVRV